MCRLTCGALKLIDRRKNMSRPASLHPIISVTSNVTRSFTMLGLATRVQLTRCQKSQASSTFKCVIIPVICEYDNQKVECQMCQKKTGVSQSMRLADHLKTVSNRLALIKYDCQAFKIIYIYKIYLMRLSN